MDRTKGPGGGGVKSKLRGGGGGIWGHQARRSNEKIRVKNMTGSSTPSGEDKIAVSGGQEEGETAEAVSETVTGFFQLIKRANQGVINQWSKTGCRAKGEILVSNQEPDRPKRYKSKKKSLQLKSRWEINQTKGAQEEGHSVERHL